jgi:hypothetical protein
MLRAVQFCREQERLVNAVVGVADPENPPLRFEAWRAQKDDPPRTITWPYVSVVAILAGAYLAGVALGLWVGDWAWWTKAAVGLAVVALLGLYLRWVLSFAVKWSDDADRAGAPAWVTASMRRVPDWIVRRPSP